MDIVVAPPNAPEWRFACEKPLLRADIFGGYSTADIPVGVLRYPDRIRAAEVRVIGQMGLAWHGIAWDRPRQGEPLHVLGPNAAGTFMRREAAYKDTSLSIWTERTFNHADRKSDVLRYGSDVNGIHFTIAASTSLTTNWFNGAIAEVPATSAGRLHIAWARPEKRVRIRVFAGTFGGGVTSEAITWASTPSLDIAGDGTGSTSGTNDVDMDAAALSLSYIDRVLVVFTIQTGYVSSASETACTFVPAWYGVAGITSATTTNIVNDCLDNFPAIVPGRDVRSFIGSETTELTAVYGPECDEVKKLAPLSDYADWDFGWYVERPTVDMAVGHWAARPTTPHYHLDISECDQQSLSDADLEPLASGARGHYTDAVGKPRHVDVYDTDPTHYLVQIGMNTAGNAKMADLPLDTKSSALATTACTNFLKMAGREQCAGSLTTALLRDNSGRRVYLPSVRPGRYVRVSGVGSGYIDVLIRQTECAGEERLTMNVDNNPYTLFRALVRKR